MTPTKPITPAYLEEVDAQFRNLEFVPVQGLEMPSRNILALTPVGSSTKREFQVDADALAWLSRFAGVPVKYVNSIDDDALAVANWNYWLRKRSENADITALKAVAKGDSIETFTFASFQPVAPSAIVRAVQGSIVDAVFEREPRLSKRDFDFSLTGSELYENFLQGIHDQGLDQVVNTNMLDGDVHHFSVAVKYNFMGDQSPEIRVLGHRHNCGNIIESPYGIGGKQFRIFTTEPAQIVQKFDEFSRKGVEFIRQTLIPHTRALMETRLTDPVADLNDLMAKHNIPERVQELVFESYRTENLGGTMYHAVNALTRAANSDRCPPDMVRRLHQLGGSITVAHDPSHPTHRCPSCHQKVNEERARSLQIAGTDQATGE